LGTRKQQKYSCKESFFVFLLFEDSNRGLSEAK
jgi:hypothetical protein